MLFLLLAMTDFSIKNNVRDFGIEFITPSDADFDATLKRFIGDFDVVVPLVEAAKPLVGFIRNNTPKEVIGISLQWSYFYPDGQLAFATPDGVSTPGILMGMKVRDPLLVGKTSLINSNELRFFSNDFGISQTIENAHKKLRSPQMRYNPNADDIERQISFVKIQRQQGIMGKIASVTVSVAGMFFNDGAFIGSDEGFFFESKAGYIKARRDFLKKLRAIKSSDKSDDEVLTEVITDISETIDSIPEHQPVAPSLRPGSHYADAQEAFNHGYRIHLKHLKEEILRRKERFPATKLVNEFLMVEDADFIDVYKKS